MLSSSKGYAFGFKRSVDTVVGFVDAVFTLLWNCTLFFVRLVFSLD